MKMDPGQLTEGMTAFEENNCWLPNVYYDKDKCINTILWCQ